MSGVCGSKCPPGANRGAAPNFRAWYAEKVHATILRLSELVSISPNLSRGKGEI